MLGFRSPADKAKMQAIDMISANIMIADANLNIMYMNASTRELLQEAESDLKEELPRFDMSTLVGANIDIFHKNPAHQRKMLAALKSQHRATINVGSRAFDLIVTPLTQGEKITGFVVEWADAWARIHNIDYRNQLQAISRAQAVIEFSPDGEILAANQNFLDASGYAMSEIKGKSHRMFLAQGAEGTQEYDELWSTLRANKPTIGDIVRYGKDGRTIFLNASYNPIADERGKIVKIVKFATDVSDRVHAVKMIGEALIKLAASNLDFSLDRPFAKDFESLRLSMNEAVERLGDTLSAVARSTDLIDSGSQEISRSADDLSKRTEQQAASLEETAAALDEITVNVKNASQRAEEARLAAQAADQSATRSGEIVSEAVGAMARIEQSSSQISNIIGVIDEIAFQTNLLALNAGVEAARAGDAGKGFAVVAQEVRELAQRSAQAAKEIKELIRNSSEEVKTGVKLVRETGEALKTIQENIVDVNGHMQAIAGSAREQSTGLSEVNSAVNQMDQSTQQNAAMVEETNAAGATLAQESVKLRQLIARFQLSGPGTTGHGNARHANPPQRVADPSPVRRMTKTLTAAFSGNAAVANNTWEEF